jgi:tetratricopeptide (TPR) repeat protein
MSEGRIDEAAAHYTAVCDAYSLVDLGDILAGSQPRRAQNYYERAIACQPGIRVPHSQLGKLFVKEGRLDAALIQFKHALDAAPEYGWSWYHIASTCLEAGRPQECVDWTSSARNRFPRDAELMTALQRLEARARQARPNADPRRRGE